MFNLLDAERVKDLPADAIADAAAVLSVIGRLFLNDSDKLNDRELRGYHLVTDAVVAGLEDLSELVAKRLGASDVQYQRGLTHGRQQGFNEAAALTPRLQKVADLLRSAETGEVSNPAPDLTEVRTGEGEESGSGRTSGSA